MQNKTETTTPYSEQELDEIRELFPDLTATELQRLITALDVSIEQVLDHYFKLNSDQKDLYSVKSQI